MMVQAVYAGAAGCVSQEGGNVMRKTIDGLMRQMESRGNPGD